MRLPEVANWALNPPLDVLFSAIRNLWGTLVLAAAGDSPADVDETETLGAFKIATWVPCQIKNVVCVGSMGPRATNISTFTNRANTSSKIDHTNTVDIFGPGVTWVDKAVGASVLNEAVRTQGTSVSSPFVAGVAALIWAANPNLIANQVEQILLSTAHPKQQLGAAIRECLYRRQEGARGEQSSADRGREWSVPSSFRPVARTSTKETLN